MQKTFWQRRPTVPMLLQTEAAECGLACLAMINTFWGNGASLAEIRREHSFSLKGSTLGALLKVSDRLNLDARPIKLGLQDIQMLRLPCILHWDMNHFVVLQGLRRRTALIHDPACGKRQITLEDLSEHFTGVAVEFKPSSLFQSTPPQKPIRIAALLGRVVGLRSGLTQLLLLGVVLQIFALAAPFYLQWVVDEVLVSSDKSLLITLGVGFLALNLIQAVMGALRSWATTMLSTDLSFQWLGNAFTHLMKLPLPFFEQRHLGDIVSRFTSLQTIQHAISNDLVESLIDGLLTISTFVVMLFYSVELSAIAAASLLAYLLVRSLVLPRLRGATSEQIVHSAKQQTHLLESIRGIQTIRLYNGSNERKLGWLNRLADQFNADLRLAKLAIGMRSASALIFGSERIVVIWLAALAVMRSELSLGMVLAFLAYKDQFAQRGTALVDRILQLRMLSLHGERVADILFTLPEENRESETIGHSWSGPSIELRDVTFQYARSEPFVLRDFSLVIPEGQCVAITGVSGSGKTTLAKLLLGLLTPSSGEVLVGGLPLRQVGLTRHREYTSAVMQDDQLFSGTILDNVCFFDPAPDPDRIAEATRAAAIYEDINKMPMGFHTLIGDIGSGLSGGQKQRLLLARALYRRPQILILDEATSHLDMWNEQVVNAAIKNLRLTRVVIAHRAETIAMAERVLVIHEGTLQQDLPQSVLRRQA
jgi:ATP-binding cassette, subfamily B, bacterial CvaB/MchF/RaxB